jgi:hypothetical protein
VGKEIVEHGVLIGFAGERVDAERESLHVR